MIDTTKLCLFCQHFDWSKEEMWKMGSTLTGPMFSGGDVSCARGHFNDRSLPIYPSDLSDWHAINFTAQDCGDFQLSDELKEIEKKGKAK